MQSTQEAALQMVDNYYFSKSKNKSDIGNDNDDNNDYDWATHDEIKADQSQCEKGDDDSNEKMVSTTGSEKINNNSYSDSNGSDADNSVSNVRIHPPRSQEEVAF